MEKFTQDEIKEIKTLMVSLKNKRTTEESWKNILIDSAVSILPSPKTYIKGEKGQLFNDELTKLKHENNILTEQLNSSQRTIKRLNGKSIIKSNSLQKLAKLYSEQKQTTENELYQIITYCIQSFITMRTKNSQKIAKQLGEKLINYSQSKLK